MKAVEEKSAEELAAEAVDRMTPEAAPQEAEVVEAKEPPKEQVPAPSVAVAHRPADIAVREGALVPQSLTEMTRIAKGLISSGCVPKQLDSVEKVLMAMQFLGQLGLPTVACLPRICIINGSYSLWGEGPKAICQPDIEDIEEFLFDAEYNRICFANKNLNVEVYGALCRVKRKGIATWVECSFTIDDAKRAGLINKSGPWKEYRPRMLQMRCRAWALKDGFSDRLMGLAIAEYDFHTTVNETGDVEPTEVAAVVVKERFK